MANDIKMKYGLSDQVITCTIASLANTGSRQSDSINNTVNQYQDALVFIKVKVGTATSVGVISISVYATADGGSNYTDGASGSDGTFSGLSNAKGLGLLATPVTGTTYFAGPFSVAKAFGGRLPDHWTVSVNNFSGGTLSATPSDHKIFYQGIYTKVG